MGQGTIFDKILTHVKQHFLSVGMYISYSAKIVFF